MAVDPKDVRVMIPEVRRAIDGPTATSSAAVSATLTDEQVKNLIADALGDLILLTGGVFGKDLVPTHTDSTYGAPDEWETSEELTYTEKRLVSAQAALSYYFERVKALKMSESISDEGQSYSYQLSSTLLRDQMNLLVRMRDDAVAALQAAGAGLDSWVDLVASRDAIGWAFLEPSSHYGGSGSNVGGQALDPRGFQ